MKDQEIKYIDLLRLKEERFKYFTIEESLKAVRESGWNLQFVKYQTPEICLEAIKIGIWNFQHIINQTEEVCLAAYKQSPDCVEFIRIDIKDEKLRDIIEKRYEYFTLEESLEAVRKYGPNLKLVKYQTPEICLEAVRQYGYALEYVKQQTEEICLEAYRQNPHSILYIKDTFEEYRKRKLYLIESVI